MKINFTFKELFSVITENGVSYKAIILYRKLPLVYTNVIDNGSVRSIVSQWVKMLIIDLWIVELKFTWKTKLR